MRLGNLKIDPDFRDCLPKMSLDEYCQLEKNILAHGIQSPLIIWNDYIVDGHNRYNICFNNHIQEVPVTEAHFESKEEAIKWILENQLGRRNLSDFARNEVALKYKEVIARKAKERQREGQEAGRTARYSGLRSNDQKPDEQINTRTEIAKIAGTNDSSVKRTEYILKNGTEEEIERARNGGKGNSLGTVFREIKEREIPEDKKLCSKCFEVKPREEFRADRSKPDGLASTCNACHNAESRKQAHNKAVESACAEEKETEEMTIGQIRKVLKDENAEISLTEKDVIAMVESNVANFIASIKGILAMDSDAFNKCKKSIRETIETGINHLYEDAL